MATYSRLGRVNGLAAGKDGTSYYEMDNMAANGNGRAYQREWDRRRGAEPSLGGIGSGDSRRNRDW